MKQIFALCMTFFFLGALFAERGIVVTTNDKYVHQYLLGSIYHLREIIGSTLPIEVWHDGDELSFEVIDKLKQFSNITFCDFEEVFKGKYGNLRGWHAKPFMLLGSRFDEICIMDADVYFLDDPEKLFFHQKYIETGTFFFRDRFKCFPIKNHPFYTIENFLKRKGMFQTLVLYPSTHVPSAFLHLWDLKNPTFEHPQLGEFQESGCVYIDRNRHKEGIDIIIDLTNDREYIYDCVMGDKETFWLGLELAKEPYAFNEGIPCAVISSDRQNTMVHFVDGKLLYHQKEPVLIGSDAFFYGSRGVFDDYWDRKTDLEERKILQKAYYSYRKYHN